MTNLNQALLVLVVGLLGLGASLRQPSAWAGNPPAHGEPEKIPTIQEIMSQSHSCSNNYIYRVRRELQKEDPDWYILANRGDDLVRLGKLLGKNTPPRGTRESWEHLTNVYVAHATLLADAAEREDKAAAVVHQKALSSMCATCHRAHRGR